MTESNCPVCATEIARRFGKGRPPVYCSVEHRRIAERRRRQHLVDLGRALERALAEQESGRKRA